MTCDVVLSKQQRHISISSFFFQKMTCDMGTITIQPHSTRPQTGCWWAGRCGWIGEQVGRLSGWHLGGCSWVKLVCIKGGFSVFPLGVRAGEGVPFAT